jgi:hypothetical protein
VSFKLGKLFTVRQTDQNKFLEMFQKSQVIFGRKLPKMNVFWRREFSKNSFLKWFLEHGKKWEESSIRNM